MEILIWIPLTTSMNNPRKSTRICAPHLVVFTIIIFQNNWEQRKCALAESTRSAKQSRVPQSIKPHEEQNRQNYEKRRAMISKSTSHHIPENSKWSSQQTHECSEEENLIEERETTRAAQSRVDETMGQPLTRTALHARPLRHDSLVITLCEAVRRHSLK
jgi:hypothetical protein